MLHPSLMVFFYSTPFWGRVYKWKFCSYFHLSVHLFVCHNFSFNRYLSISRSNKKKFKRQGAFFSNFASGRTFPTQSTGPQAPFFTDIWVSVAQIKKLKKTRCFFSSSYFASGRTLPTQSTGPKPNSTGPQALFFTDICH